MMNHVARALRPGGPEVIDVASQPLPSPDALDPRTVLIRVDAVGLNHADSLIRSGTYSLTLPFPYVVGLEGAGTIVATGPETSLRAGARVCWTGVFGSCAAFVVAPEAMLAPLPDHVTAEEGARLAHAGITTGGIFVTKFNGRAYVDGPADAVGLIGEAIALAAARPAVMTDVAGRFPLDRAADAYRLLESGARGKVLVLPQPSQA